LIKNRCKRFAAVFFFLFDRRNPGSGPESLEMLDPDPVSNNPDPQRWILLSIAVVNLS
jgi:hypothetical protein